MSPKTKEYMHSDHSIKEKFLYLWEYYRYMTLGAIILIIFVGSFAFSIINKKSSVLTIDFYTTQYDSTKQDNLVKQVEKLANPGVKEEVSIAHTDSSDANANEKMAAEIAAKSVDILALEQKSFTIQSNNGAFMDLSKMIDEKKLETADVVRNNQNKIVGIEGHSLSKLDVLIGSKKVILGIPINAPNKKMAVKIIESWLE